MLEEQFCFVPPAVYTGFLSTPAPAWSPGCHGTSPSWCLCFCLWSPRWLTMPTGCGSPSQPFRDHPQVLSHPCQACPVRWCPVPGAGTSPGLALVSTSRMTQRTGQSSNPDPGSPTALPFAYTWLHLPPWDPEQRCEDMGPDQRTGPWQIQCSRPKDLSAAALSSSLWIRPFGGFSPGGFWSLMQTPGGISLGWCLLVVEGQDEQSWAPSLPSPSFPPLLSFSLSFSFLPSFFLLSYGFYILIRTAYIYIYIFFFWK